jgi:hydroxymethylpyrimidine/phosphomethylpyrimidine kinase
MSRCHVPVVLTIAGSDPSGGAGIQGDLKTFTALGVYGAAVITALTAQSTQGVTGVQGVPTDFVALQIATLADDMTIAAVKTGMLNDAATVRAVAEAITRHKLHPLIVDPVMVATSGDALLEDDAVAALRDELLPLADLLTPNLPEAARLLGVPVAADEAQMTAQAQALLDLGCKAVVLKGGHASGPEAVDIFLQRGAQPVRLVLPRVATPNTHGTGCAFSAAVAALLAIGDPLSTAVIEAKRFVHAALESGAERRIGNGAGPIDHLHAIPQVAWQSPKSRRS